MTCHLQKMDWILITIFRTCETSAPRWGCTSLVDIPWDLYHPSWNLPKTNPSVSRVSVHDLASSTPRSGTAVSSVLLFAPFLMCQIHSPARSWWFHHCPWSPSSCSQFHGTWEGPTCCMITRWTTVITQSLPSPNLPPCTHFPLI